MQNSPGLPPGFIILLVQGFTDCRAKDAVTSVSSVDMSVSAEAISATG